MSSVLMILVMLVIYYFFVARPKLKEKNGVEKEGIQYVPTADEEILATSKRCRIDAICIFVIFLCVASIVLSIWEIHMEKELYYPYHRTKPYEVWLVCSIIGTILSVLFYWWLSKMEIVVTNKRVYGCVAFGKRVDLPIDSISAVGMSMFNGLAVGSSSGRIVFSLLQNRDAVHNAISDLLIERQSHESATTITQTIPLSNADELKKYKELLDDGIITQEEFDAKKKQLLNL